MPASPKKSAPAKAAPAPGFKQPPVLFDKTQAMIQKIEKRLGGKLVTYWNGSRGSVCHNDVTALFRLLEHIGPQDTLYLFVKSDGGNGRAALRMVNLIRRYCKKLVALAPLECASAATMIALGAEEIQMGPIAYLTAVDTSLTHDLSPIDRDNDRVSVSLDEVKRVISLWRHNEGAGSDMNPYHALFQYIHPLVIGAVDRADSLSLMLCEEILSHHVRDAKKRRQIATTLNSKYPSHAYPVLIEEARRIGLNAVPMDPGTASMLLDLNHIYSEMGQKATTDISDRESHGNEIINILEREHCQIYYQQDKDWFYRAEERRWIVLNDDSSWHQITGSKGRMDHEVLFM
ncbi:MAG TPA: hypothetical protein PK490_19250 [Prosthecobacter sp.]|nr:hypothetical protein [Prosthecobacter sp.]HRK16426.1 hypothetical protein [Prosthecobacter sp.]